MATTKKLYLEEQQNSLASQLQKLMMKHDISEAELSRKTHILQPTLHKILTGKTADPRGSTLSILANHFNISIDELYSGVDGVHKHVPAPDTQSIPILSWRECLKTETLITELHPNNWHHWLTVEFIDSQAFALESRPCMEARFPPKTLFVIDPTLTPEDGDLIIVHYVDTEAATIRGFSSDGPEKWLLPITTNAEACLLSDHVEILGVVVQTRLNYKPIHKKD